MSARNKAFDGTLNTIGHISYNAYDDVGSADIYTTSGHGYSGAEGYPCHVRLTSRKPPAE